MALGEQLKEPTASPSQPATIVLREPRRLAVPDAVPPPSDAPEPSAAGASAPGKFAVEAESAVPQEAHADFPAQGCPPRRCIAPWRNRWKPCLQYTHWGYADEFEEVPLGVRVSAHLKTQVCNGLAAQMVLYRYDFCQATPQASQLNPHGQKRLQEIKALVQSCGFHPVTIEATGDAGLDAARRQFVLQRLLDADFAIPDEWVVVADAEAPAMRSEEAVEVHRKMIRGIQGDGIGTQSVPRGISGLGGQPATGAGLSTGR
jgi:hypothetical protein